ncbi:MAG: hypothetical protein N4A49_10490 [Marinifilaceae bacterium]|jgi:exonuclease SbcC|nr:hypothetical protein [Marinifilaceae bacterium]
MKILNIRLLNINSLKGKNSLNFQEGAIADTGLFAITGVTGSGKSSILDGITMALYNQTPRNGSLSKEKINQAGAIITRGTRESYAELEYESANQIYRTKWSIAYNRNNNLNADQMELSKKNDNGEFEIISKKKSEVIKKNEEISGLNYDQFIKSILLSQGEFAKFLKAKADERSALLEKITGTEIYREIGKTAFAKHKEESERLNTLKAKTENIERLNDDELKKITEELKNNSTEYEVLLKEENELRQQIETKQNIEILEKSNKEKLIELELQNSELKDQENNKIKLAKHEKAIILKPEIQGIKDKETSLKELNEFIIKTKKEQEENKINKAKLDKESLRINKEYSDLENNKKENLVIISSVRKYDNEIEGLKLTISEKEKNKLDHKDSKNKTEKEIHESKVILEKLKLQKIKITEFLKSNPNLDKLRDYLTKWKSESSTIAKKLNDLNLDLLEEDIQTILKGNKYSIGQKRDILNNHLSEKRKKITILTEQENISQKEIIEHENKLNTAKTNIEILILRTNNYHKLSDEIKQNKTEHIELINKLNKSEEKLLNISKELEISDLSLVELNARFQRELKEKAYEKDRKELQKDQRCPICGSTEHPYKKEYKAIIDTTKSQLETIELKNSELKKIQNKEEKLKTELEQKSKLVDERIKKITEEIQRTQIEIESIEINIENKYNLDKISNSKEYIISKLKKLEEIKFKIISQEKLIKYIDMAENIFNEINYLSGRIKLITDESLLYKDIIKDEVLLNRIFPILETKLSKYEEKKDSLIEIEKDIERLNTELNIKTNNLVDLDKIIIKTEDEISRLSLDFKRITKIRHDLFGEKNPDDFLQEIELKINKSLDTKSLISGKLIKLDEKISYNIDQLETSNLRIKQTGNLLNEQIKSAQQELVKMGFIDLKEIETSILDQDEAEKFKNKLNKIEKKLIQLKQSIADNRAKLEKLYSKNNSNYNLLELTTKQSSLKSKTAQLNQEIGALHSQIKKDKELKSKYSEIEIEIKKQEKELNKWAIINHLIGDAKGSKFSKFAQELTLLQMLNTANKHLQKLNSRYLIKYNKTKADDLFVIDCIQGDTERSVRTLSGGETFLVSMALALGLSDLAGQNTKIESLFIDEGFGSLDQETLDIALSTLEKLQAESNRTIGIISHVEALKERITTQVVLEKNSQGYSKIFMKE